MEKTRKKLKWWVKLLIILGSVIVFLGVVILGAIAVFRLGVNDYYKASEKAFVIPGLKEDFVPQGFHYDEEKQWFVVSGYHAKDKASPVYIVDKKSGQTLKKVNLATAKGKAFTGHAGGVAVYGEYLYIAGGGKRCVYVFSYTELSEAKNGESISCKGSVSVSVSDEDYVGVSFVTVSGDRMIVGEFYDEKPYPTLQSHHIQTAAGDMNYAIALEYQLSKTAEFGISSAPTKAYTMRGKVQGICLSGGKMYLSTSYGITFSRIYEYDESRMVSEGEMEILGQKLPLYAIDSASLVKEYKIAPMSEEMVMLDGKLYVMCESASSKYIFGNLIGGKWCYKTDLSKMK
ncbi:MAG: hypothetical protein IJX88_02550 [Clostridia bacterium]|nr:hypothetical protein [Clostridia bacterium]